MIIKVHSGITQYVQEYQGPDGQCWYEGHAKMMLVFATRVHKVQKVWRVYALHQYIIQEWPDSPLVHWLKRSAAIVPFEQQTLM